MEPTQIERYSVIRVPLQFNPGADPEFKLLVVFSHDDQIKPSLICLKLTSKEPLNPEGCVFLPAGSITFLGQDTWVQPDNLFPVTYEQVQRYNNNGDFTVLGTLAEEFPTRLRTAIGENRKLTPKRKDYLLQRL